MYVYIITAYSCFVAILGMKNLIRKYELPRPEEVAALKQKLEKCHSLDLSFHANV